MTNLIMLILLLLDVAWLVKMEESPFHAALLAGDCGIGKTVIILLFIFLQWEMKKEIEDAVHLPTLILAPSALTTVWYNDWKKFFKELLVCKLFLSKVHIFNGEREDASIGSTAEELDAYLGSLDTTSPEVRSTTPLLFTWLNIY